MANKTKESQLRANKKWRQKNQYTTAIRFNKNTCPEEMFEKCKEEIRKMGMSQNEFFITKLKELIKNEGE